MKIKNSNGVTLTILVLTIVVMLILFSITFSSATDLLRNSQRNKMKSMLYMVQSRAEILLEEYLFDNDGEDLNNIADAKIIEALKGKLTPVSDLKSVGYNSGSDTLPAKGTTIYCSWGEDVLKSQGIDTKNLADGDTIVIQYNVAENTVDVASTKGFSADGQAIHSLKDF